MDTTTNPAYILLYITPAFFSVGLSIYSWQRYHVRYARWFSLSMAAVAIWSLCHSLAISTRTLDYVLLWSQIQYIGIVTVGPFWLLFALSYSHHPAQHSKLLKILLTIYVISIYAIALTNSYHHLLWSSVSLDTSRDFGSLKVTRGPAFWVHFVISYSCVLFGIYYFIRAALNTPAPYRPAAWLVVSGALIPSLGNVLHILGFRLDVVDDPTIFLFTASGIVMSYATLRYQLLDLTPMAQREIFESLPDGVIVIDQRGHIAAINENAAPFLDIHLDNWIGLPFLESIRTSKLHLELSRMLQPPAAPNTREVSYNMNNELRTVEIRIRPLSYNEQRAGTLIVMRDQTTRSQVEFTLAQRVNELTALSQIARTTNTALNSGDIPRTIIRELLQHLNCDRVSIGLMNQQEGKLRIIIDEGFDDEGKTLEGQTFFKAEYPSIYQHFKEHTSGIIRTDEPTGVDPKLLQILENMDIHMVMVIPLYTQSDALGIMFVGHSVLRDVSHEELHLFETIGELVSETILRTQLYDQAQEANRVKSAFLASMTHELRTPLTAIMGFTTMLNQGIYGPMPSQALQPLDNILHSGQRLLGLINDILDFSKLEAGRFIIDLEPIHIEPVIDRVVSILQPQIQNKKLDLQLEIEPHLPRIMGHSERLEQIIMNIVSNAIKFTDTGTITISVCRKNYYIRCEVRDTGIGIAQDMQHLIFQEFHQLHKPNSRQIEGTGLGLAISKRLIELMNGSIGFESVAGQGTTFHFDLPIIQADFIADYQLNQSTLSSNQAQR